MIIEGRRRIMSRSRNVVFTALAAALAGCAAVPYTPAKIPPTPANVANNRRYLENVLPQKGDIAWLYAGLTQENFAIVSAHMLPESLILMVTKDGGAQFPKVFRLKDMPLDAQLGAENPVVTSNAYVPLDPLKNFAYVVGHGVSNRDSFLRGVVDSLNVVKEAAIASSVAEENRFQEALKSYREAAAKPAFPEEARRFKVQAEDAVSRKDFYAAAALYNQALAAAPWWPEGRFNQALVLAEIGDFDPAIREMKRYLSLAPDASDAKAAQDSIYRWEGRVSR